MRVATYVDEWIQWVISCWCVCHLFKYVFVKLRLGSRAEKKHIFVCLCAAADFKVCAALKRQKLYWRQWASTECFRGCTAELVSFSNFIFKQGIAGSVRSTCLLHRQLLFWFTVLCRSFVQIFFFFFQRTLYLFIELFIYFSCRLINHLIDGPAWHEI